eukprot:CAMPEP_0114544746 /NCGR_PEP_ID=MMETSP0114-20121206/3037_1 /TAXON_ID=31324 /ORGANISM="Goniomonas sp, Strain m" /LENGTH=628 /DNA_ID=CAMNT_0001729139 /DNA_START=8 /DNA_END=1894 /DNA_ORIENTATION=-
MVEASESEAAALQRFLVTESLESFESWPSKKKGYRRLLGFCVFVVLYLVMISLQLNAGVSYIIDSSLRQFIRHQGGLDNVISLDDWWTYADTEFQILFQDKWYNGQAFTTNETGYVLDYNKLIGGVLIQQKRGIVTKNGCSEYLGPSAYTVFYPDCYSGELEGPGVEFGEHKSTLTADELALTNQAWIVSNDSTAYVFFGLAEGRKANFNKLAALKKGLWLDKATRRVNIKFALYNALLGPGLFTFVDIDFIFENRGIFTGGNHVEIQSFNMEPYRNSGDYVRLAIEVIFMTWIAQQLSEFILTSITTAGKDGVRAVFNAWFFVDASSLALFIIYIALRCRILSMIYSTPVEVPTNMYQPILGDIADVQAQQLLVNFLSIILSLVRFLKFYEFQARLVVMNKTFSGSATDLYHLFVLLFTVIFGYASMGMFLFGQDFDGMQSFGKAVFYLWVATMQGGGGDDYDKMEYINAEMAFLFRLTFVFVVGFILLNVLLGIICGAYQGAMEENADTVADEIGCAMQLGALSVAGKRKVSDKEIVAALQELAARGVVAASVDDIARVLDAQPLASGSAQDRRGVLAVHPLLKTESEEERPDVGASGFPADFVTQFEQAVRENSYLKQRVRSLNV